MFAHILLKNINNLEETEKIHIRSAFRQSQRERMWIQQTTNELWSLLLTRYDYRFTNIDFLGEPIQTSQPILRNEMHFKCKRIPVWFSRQWFWFYVFVRFLWSTSAEFSNVWILIILKRVNFHGEVNLFGCFDSFMHETTNIWAPRSCNGFVWWNEGHQISRRNECARRTSHPPQRQMSFPSSSRPHSFHPIKYLSKW